MSSSKYYRRKRAIHFAHSLLHAAYMRCGSVSAGVTLLHAIRHALGGYPHAR